MSKGVFFKDSGKRVQVVSSINGESGKEMYRNTKEGGTSHELLSVI